LEAVITVAPDTVEASGAIKAGRKKWIALTVLALPLLLVSMDVSVLYFAVPFISTDLHASASPERATPSPQAGT
jgi:hypothetical protein